jgi:putative membrane protein
VPAHFLRGMAMGSADVVPGVSGGTVALVLAIYHRLVTAIRNGSVALGRLLKGDVHGGIVMLRQVDWVFLIPLLAGILTAILLLAGAIEHQLEVHPVQTSGLFLGLVAGSVVVATALLTQRTVRSWSIVALSAIVFFVALGFAGTTSDEGSAGNFPLWAFFLGGAIAICAMILPGISGSFLLVVMGLYSAVLAALNERDIVTIGVFTLGCVVGLALFSQLLHWALNEHYDTVMAVMIGLMLGSVRVLWPWPNGAESTALGAPDTAVAVTVGLALLGFVVVIGLDRAARQLAHRRTSDEVDELQAT